MIESIGYVYYNPETNVIMLSSEYSLAGLPETTSKVMQAGVYQYIGEL